MKRISGEEAGNMKNKQDIAAVDAYVRAIIAVSCFMVFLAMLLIHGDTPPWLTFILGAIIGFYFRK